MTTAEILIGGNDTNKIAYYIDPVTKDMMARVYARTESGKWMEIALIHVDILVWNFAHDNNMVE
ncbi:MAG: hypothetical protein EHM34_00255 [Nitrosopumilales archaeon]|nr:MAG: hypothetical protein EHM34_00255 [Nitrosopumilales archaeon]